jgi:hypothetical protein
VEWPDGAIQVLLCTKDGRLLCLHEAIRTLLLSSMRLTLPPANARDVLELMVFCAAIDGNLAHRFSEGYGVGRRTERGALAAMERGSGFVGRFRGRIVAPLTLSTRNPWAIDARYFDPSEMPLYLTSMAVDPRHC